MNYIAKIVEAEFDTGGNAISWKIQAHHLVSGGLAPKNHRSKCRDRATEIFGTWFFRKNPPTQAQVDEAMN